MLLTLHAPHSWFLMLLTLDAAHSSIMILLSLYAPHSLCSSLFTLLTLYAHHSLRSSLFMLLTLLTPQSSHSSIFSVLSPHASHFSILKCFHSLQLRIYWIPLKLLRFHNRSMSLHNSGLRTSLQRMSARLLRIPQLPTLQMQWSCRHLQFSYGSLPQLHG